MNYPADLAEEGKASLEPVSGAEDGDYNVLCARFTPQGTRIMYVSNPDYRAHNMTMRLRAADISKAPSFKLRTVLDIVHGQPKEQQFPGLYIGVQKPLLQKYVKETRKRTHKQTGGG